MQQTVASSSLPEREGHGERVQVDADGRSAELGVVTAAEARGDLHHDRPRGPEPELGVRGAVRDPDRRDGAPCDRDRLLDVVSGRPCVGERDSERGRRRRHAVGDRQRHEAAVERDGVHGHLGPVDVLLDEHRAAAGLCERGRERVLELVG